MVESSIDPRTGQETGQIICSLDACRKVLHTYTGKANAPRDDRPCYWLMSADIRYLYADKSGRATPSAKFDGMANIMNFYGTWGGRGYGFHFRPDTSVQQLDFCSDACAATFLQKSESLSVCIFKEGRTTRMVAQERHRFRTEVLIFGGPFEPGEAILIGNKACQVYLSKPMPDGNRQPLVNLYAAAFQCPLPVQGKECQQWVLVIRDVVPAVWRCPFCGGFYILDRPSQQHKYAYPSPDIVTDSTGDTPADTVRLVMYAYGRLQQLGESGFVSWMEARFGKLGSTTNAIAISNDDVNYLGLNHPRFQNSVVQLPWPMDPIEAITTFGQVSQGV